MEQMACAQNTVCVVAADCPEERGYVLRVAMVKSKRFWAEISELAFAVDGPFIGCWRYQR
jgi:hypothetical protein